MPAPVLPKKPVPTAKAPAKAASKPAPKPKKKVLSFSENLRLTDRAGRGVILIRTREPIRVLDSLKFFTYSRKNPETGELDSKFRVWDCIRGWVEYAFKVESANGQSTVKEQDPAIIADTTEVAEALGLIQDMKNLGKEPWPSTVAVMNYPHLSIKDSPEFIVTLKQYCHTLPTGRSRVILIVPDGFSMPSELEDDITILDFSVPNQAELKARFLTLLEEFDKECPYDEAGVDAITSAGLGMTELDFDQAVSLAIAETTATNDDPLTAELSEFLAVIYRCKTEAVKRTNMLELIDPLPVDELGGQENVKAWATKRKKWFTKAAQLFGLRPPRGALALGLPGTGKSLLARVLGWIFAMVIVRFDISKVFGKFVGESEARMDIALAFIRAIAPVIVWVDEIDKAGLSGDSANESSKRVLGKLLTFMQEAPDGVFFIFTANRPDNLPAELLRPGRLNITFGVILPNPTERADIFRIHMVKRNQDWDSLEDSKLAIDASEGYTGAEIEEAVNSAVGVCFENDTPVTGALLADEIKFIKPQSVSHAVDYAKVTDWCKQNAIPASLEGAQQENRQVVTGAPKKAIRKLG